jgi:hypothetical protein
MEIEKKRETSWKIHIKKSDEFIEITSVELSGLVRSVKLALSNNERLLNVEMTKEEFFNFLSLLIAFRDVIIGEDSPPIFSDPILDLREDLKNNVDDEYNIKNDEQKPKEVDENGSNELNPEEWDPW